MGYSKRLIEKHEALISAEEETTHSVQDELEDLVVMEIKELPPKDLHSLRRKSHRIMESKSLDYRLIIGTVMLRRC